MPPKEYSDICTIVTVAKNDCGAVTTVHEIALQLITIRDYINISFLLITIYSH